jgi:hypothetical protein
MSDRVSDTAQTGTAQVSPSSPPTRTRAPVLLQLQLPATTALAASRFQIKSVRGLTSRSIPLSVLVTGTGVNGVALAGTRPGG